MRGEVHAMLRKSEKTKLFSVVLGFLGEHGLFNMRSVVVLEDWYGFCIWSIWSNEIKIKLDKSQ